MIFALLSAADVFSQLGVNITDFFSGLYKSVNIVLDFIKSIPSDLAALVSAFLIFAIVIRVYLLVRGSNA